MDKTLIKIPFNYKLVYFNNLINQPEINKETLIFTNTKLPINGITLIKDSTSRVLVGSIKVNAVYQLHRWDVNGLSLDGNSNLNLLMFIWIKPSNQKIINVPRPCSTRDATETFL